MCEWGRRNGGEEGVDGREKGLTATTWYAAASGTVFSKTASSENLITVMRATVVASTQTGISPPRVRSRRHCWACEARSTKPSCRQAYRSTPADLRSTRTNELNGGSVHVSPVTMGTSSVGMEPADLEVVEKLEMVEGVEGVEGVRATVLLL